MTLTLSNHPVHADQRCIENDGVRIGYCGSKAGMPVNLIVRLTPANVDEIKTFVETQVGEVSKVCMVPLDPPSPKNRRKRG